MKLSVLGLLLLLCSGCLFFDSSTEKAENKPTVIETDCEGNVIDFDVVALSSGGFASVESCPNLAVLKRFVGGRETIDHVWETGSQTISLAQHENEVLVGLGDSVYRCSPDCELIEVFKRAKEILVATFDDESAYLVRYQDEINFFHVVGDQTRDQKEVRAGNFTNLQLMVSPVAGGFGFMATAQSGGIIHRFLEDGDFHRCTADVDDRGAFFGETDDQLIIAHKTTTGRLAFKVLTSSTCAKQPPDELDGGIDTFDLYITDSKALITAVSVGPNVIITRNFFGDREQKKVVDIVSGGQFEIAMGSTDYFLGVLFEDTLEYQFGAFP